MKLTKGIKTKIIADIINASKGIKKLQLEIAKLAQLIANEYYNRKYSPEEQKLIEKMPDGWKVERRSISIISTKLQLMYKGKYQHRTVVVNFPHSLSIPSVHYSLTWNFSEEENESPDKLKNDKLYSLFKTYITKRNELITLKSKISNIVETATTDKKLIEVWPEIESIVKRHANNNDDSKALVDQKTIDEVNQKIKPLSNL